MEFSIFFFFFEPFPYGMLQNIKGFFTRGIRLYFQCSSVCNVQSEEQRFSDFFYLDFAATKKHKITHQFTAPSPVLIKLTIDTTSSPSEVFRELFCFKTLQKSVPHSVIKQLEGLCLWAFFLKTKKASRVRLLSLSFQFKKFQKPQRYYVLDVKLY